jgi:uncharacterized protein
MIRKFWFILFVVSLFFIPFALGTKGDITLVTVGETPSGVVVGGTADLILEVKPGSGKVYIDSFPFTREDTQVSIRFAKDVACNFLEVDCSVLDFFYSINIGSSSVGGPSAGAAITILTISILDNVALDDGVVITGTINSGGIIGPVSGLEAKAVAARNAGFDKILIPKRSILFDTTFNNINDSDDLNESELIIYYADSLVVSGIEIVTVSTLEEALFEFTGKQYPDYSYNITVSEQYQDIMSRVAGQLCDRSSDILDNIPLHIRSERELELDSALNSVALGLNATNSSDFYSAASFCFTANSALRRLEFEAYDNVTLENIASDLSISIDTSLDELNSMRLRTMSDLETYIIVKERLLEARQALDEPSYLNELSYIMERRYSAIAWSSFFEYRGRSVVLDDIHLANACVSKISEAEERLSYIDFLSGMTFNRSELKEARMFYEEEDFAFCVFKASKVKADANAIILSMSISSEKMEEVIDDQLTFARMQINKQGEHFPILGYSYYNYATTLKDSRPQLSMIFAEYASEFSNLDMYFPSQRAIPWRLIIFSYDGFLFGLIIGFILCVGVISGSVLFRRSFKNRESDKVQTRKSKSSSTKKSRTKNKE